MSTTSFIIISLILIIILIIIIFSLKIKRLKFKYNLLDKLTGGHNSYLSITYLVNQMRSSEVSELSNRIVKYYVKKITNQKDPIDLHRVGLCVQETSNYISNLKNRTIMTNCLEEAAKSIPAENFASIIAEAIAKGANGGFNMDTWDKAKEFLFPIIKDEEAEDGGKKKGAFFQKFDEEISLLLKNEEMDHKIKILIEAESIKIHTRLQY